MENSNDVQNITNVGNEVLADASISKLPKDVMSFLNELNDLTDPYDANYIGSRVSNRLNHILKKYS